MTLFFVVLVTAILPLLSALSYRNIRRMEAEWEEPLQLQKGPIYLQSIFMQGAVALIGYFVADYENLTIPLGSTFGPKQVLAALAFVGLALVLAWWSNKAKKAEEEPSTLKYILPDSGRDRLLWILAVVVAAFCEEYVYRGVLYQLLVQQTVGLTLLAALVSAIVFAFGHGTQGEKAIVQIIPFALGFHLLVYLSGGLLLAIIAHFVYNVAVELLFGDALKKGGA